MLIDRTTNEGSDEMSKQFKAGQKVWVEGEVVSGKPVDGDILITFRHHTGSDEDEISEYIDPATIHAAPPAPTFTGYVIDADGLNLFTNGDRMADYLKSIEPRRHRAEWASPIRVDPEPQKPEPELSPLAREMIDGLQAWIDERKKQWKEAGR